MESSRNLLNPRNANGRMVEMLLPSIVSFRSTLKPANASPFITGKLFFVRESSSTVCGSCWVGMSFNPPVLQRTCKICWSVIFWKRKVYFLVVNYVTMLRLISRWLINFLESCFPLGIPTYTTMFS